MRQNRRSALADALLIGHYALLTQEGQGRFGQRAVGASPEFMSLAFGARVLAWQSMVQTWWALVIRSSSTIDWATVGKRRVPDGSTGRSLRVHASDR